MGSNISFITRLSGVRWGPTQNLDPIGSAALMFMGYKKIIKNKQTPRQTSKVSYSFYIYTLLVWVSVCLSVHLYQINIITTLNRWMLKITKMCFNIFLIFVKFWKWSNCFLFLLYKEKMLTDRQGRIQKGRGPN